MKKSSANLLLKFGIVSMTAMTLIATGETGSTGGGGAGGGGAGGAGGVGDSLLSLSPNDTISANSFSLKISIEDGVNTYTLATDINNKARANTRYYDKATKKWTRIPAHALILTASLKTAVEIDNATEKVVLKQFETGTGSANKVSILLASTTSMVEIEMPSKEMNAAEILAINLLIDTAIEQVNNVTDTPEKVLEAIKPVLEGFGINLPDNVTDIVNTAVENSNLPNSPVGGLVLPNYLSGIAPNEAGNILSTGIEGESGGLYGGFAVDVDGNKQFTSFYAKEDGSTHIGKDKGVDGTQKVMFAGARRLDGKISTLIGNGKVKIDFGAGKLNTLDDGLSIATIAQGGSDKLSFSLTYDGGDKLFKSEAATYKVGTKTLTGNAEAAIFKKGSDQSVLGAVDLRSGDDVMVGGFGNEPVVKDKDGNVVANAFGN